MIHTPVGSMPHECDAFNSSFGEKVKPIVDKYFEDK